MDYFTTAVARRMVRQTADQHAPRSENRPGRVVNAAPDTRSGLTSPAPGPSGSATRTAMVTAGIIRPRPDPNVVPAERSIARSLGVPVLALDDVGRRAAERHLAEGEHGRRIMRLPFRGW